MGLLSWVGRSVKELVDMGFPESVAKRISSGELPMDEASRLARAAEQGYNIDKPVYHGTDTDFNSFDPERAIGTQYWSTTDKAAIESGEVGAEGSGVIKKLAQRINNPAGWREYDQLGTDEMIGRGYGGVALKEGDDTTYIAFQPSQYKDFDRAAYDPEYVGDNLLGSRVAPTAASGLLGALALMESEDSEAGLSKAAIQALRDTANKQRFGDAVESGGVVSILPKTKSDTFDETYRGGHTAPTDPEYHSPLFDVTEKGTYPSDIYSDKGQRYYGHGDPKVDRESFKQINKAKGNPEAMIDIYRAVPLDAPEDINVGDWVSTSKEYAKQHGEGLDKYKILKSSVPASKLRTDGNSPHEWGYTGSRVLPTATSGVLGSPDGLMSPEAEARQELDNLMGQYNEWLGRNEDVYNYGEVAPVKRNVVSGDYSLAVPKLADEIIQGLLDLGQSRKTGVVNSGTSLLDVLF